MYCIPMLLFSVIPIWNHWRSDMKKYVFTLKTISPVILSPRMQGALYNEIDYKKDDSTKFEIIYPFYSFDNRYNKSGETYREASSYYIPASSFKGALQLKDTVELASNEKPENVGKYFICSDITVPSNLIQVKSLKKYQYLYQESGSKEPKLEAFFPKVGVEMLKREVTLTGEIMVKEIEVDWGKICRKLNGLAIRKFKNNIEEIDKLEEKYNKKAKEAAEQKLERNYQEKLQKLFELREELKKKVTEIEEMEAKSKAYIFLGGFKGLLQSISDKNPEEEFNGTSFFIDEEEDSKLLYGLTILEIKE